MAAGDAMVQPAPGTIRFTDRKVRRLTKLRIALNLAASSVGDVVNDAARRGGGKWNAQAARRR